MITLTPILSLIAGLALLFSGRKVFWLAAGLITFLFTYNLLLGLLGRSSIVALVVALVLGLILAQLAIRFVKLMGVILGGLAGAVALPPLLHLLGIAASSGLLAIIGAILGAILVLAVFDFGLVLLTAWLGATAVSQGASQLIFKGSAIWAVVFVALLVVGIGVQLSQWSTRSV